MHSFQKLFVLLVWAGLASGFALNAFGQGSAFTYQGQLTAGGKAANGSFDMEFSLFNAATSGTQVGSTVTKSGVGVTNGLFTVQADFGAAPYNGQALWLQITVSPAGSNTFTALSPLQPLTSTPYSVQALNAGTVTAVPNSALPASPTFSGTVTAASFAGNGAGLTNLTGESGYQNTALGIAALSQNTGGSDNTVVGYFALEGNTTGFGNTATGAEALNANSTGTYNTAFGFDALQHNSSGYDNIAFGAYALFNLGSGFTTGSNNIAIGLEAGLNYLTNESGNIDIGNPGVAGDNNIIRIGTPGTHTNTFIAGVINGNGAGLTNLSAAQLTGNNSLNNFFIGPAGNTTTTGFNDTALGINALMNNTSGDFDTAFGVEALQNNTTGYENTASGAYALLQNRTGYNNTAYGYLALSGNNSGNYNTAFGADALYQLGSFAPGGNDNIAIGNGAGVNYNINETDNIDIGNTGVQGENGTIHIGTPGTHTNTFIAGVINGNGAGLTNLSAAQLVSSGYTNGGVNNFFVGPSGNAATSGNCNTAIGVQALFNDTTGSFNTANGFDALALNTTGSYNTANGFGALVLNTTGSANTANGYESLGNNTSGSGNIALGDFAGQYITNGNNNIDIGNNGVAGDNNIIRIGSGQAQTFIAGVINGNGVSLSGPSHLNDNALYLRGDTNHGLAYAGTGVTNFGTLQPDGPVLWGYTGGVLGTLSSGAPAATLSWNYGSVSVNGTVYANGVALTSDRNAKENFAAVDASSVLAKVAAMPISEWNYKTDPADKKHLGPMAQDFQTAFGLDGNDDKHISMVDEGGVALAAIQGLNQKVEAKDALIQKQATEIADLKARLDALEHLVQQNADRPKEKF